jgi:hypothetical protein
MGGRPSADVIAVVEVRALLNLPLLGAPAQVTVDWQSLPTQLPRFAPALAGGLIVLCPMISAT